ncbi:MAG TPA: farnesyl diphosphate synthase [Patescibacteria group bacterium]|nr:farnesyl diphosphate synthase [Patescibacteria group bacterium]
MLKAYCQDKIQLIEGYLKKYLEAEGQYPPLLYEAMAYSLFAGGKRLRPILLMAAADAVGGRGDQFLPVASGMEMIHTYSLIHDDLPAMDNDDYRRGKLTNHKVYGDGIAILAGDGLLTAAFSVMLSQENVEPAVLCQVVREISVAAGPRGMVGGQVVDLASEGKMLDEETLKWMHAAKTGALFRASIRSGAILAGADSEQLQQLTEYAEQFGLAFQITDDILDVVGSQEKIGKSVGSDQRNDKATYVSLYALDGARSKADAAVANALKALEPFGAQADILRKILLYLTTREE